MKRFWIGLGLAALALFAGCRAEPAATPGPLDQLSYAERKTRIHTFTLIHGNPPEFVLTLAAPGGEPRTHVLELDEAFNGNRFQITGHCLKQVQGEAGILTTVTELEITDQRSQKVHALRSNQQLKVPDYYAKFQFLSEPDYGPLFVKEGEEFSLPGDEERLYTLLEAAEDRVLIGETGQKPREILIAAQGE